MNEAWKLTHSNMSWVSGLVVKDPALMDAGMND